MSIRFIVTGMGRSGTLWLSRLLDQDPGVAVHHEPLAQYDAQHYAEVYYGGMDVVNAVVQRIPRMEKIQRRHRDRDYAEVNSYVRYYVPALRNVLRVPIAAIVRDGRYVVRSLLARGCYQREEFPPIRPPTETGPFASCCWYWADAYRRLLETGIPIIRLEALNEGFKTFQILCQYLHVEVTMEQWRGFAGNPDNVDVGNAPLEWSDEQNATFDELAGYVWRALGYG
jgi:hypothetical protein